MHTDMNVNCHYRPLEDAQEPQHSCAQSPKCVLCINLLCLYLEIYWLFITSLKQGCASGTAGAQKNTNK